MSRSRVLNSLIIFIALAALAPAGQKVETVNGVRVVHNSGPGAWGKAAKVALEPVRVLGDVDTADENLSWPPSPTPRLATLLGTWRCNGCAPNRA